ncbi:hypothetical protein HDU76_008117, partial [Blyttiomyces sp. JEL0837]
LGGLSQTSIQGVPTVVGGGANGIQLAINLAINNPSNLVLISHTDAVFDLQYAGQSTGLQTVGKVILPDLVLNLGPQTLQAVSYVKPDPNNAQALQATREMLTRFTSGDNNIQVTVANGKSSNMPSLDAAFGALALNQHLPPSTAQLIKNTRFTFPNLLTLSALAGLTAFNPFDTPVQITHVKASLQYDLKFLNIGLGSIGTIDDEVSGFSIPAKSFQNSPPLHLKINLDAQAIGALLKAIGKGLKINVISTLTVDFGGYKTTIDYTQTNIHGAAFNWEPFSTGRFTKQSNIKKNM